VNDYEEHILGALNAISKYKNVVLYELLPYHRFGGSKYGYLGKVYELEDFPSTSSDVLQGLQGLIDEAFKKKGG